MPLEEAKTVRDPAVVAGWFLGCLVRLDAREADDSEVGAFAPFVPASNGADEAGLIRSFLDDLDPVTRGQWTMSMGKGLLSFAERVRSIKTIVLGFDLMVAVDANSALNAALDLFSSVTLSRFRSEDIEPLALAVLAGCTPQDRAIYFQLRSAMRSQGLWSDALLLQEARIEALSVPWQAHRVFAELPGLETVLKNNPDDASFFAVILHAGLPLEALALTSLRSPRWFSDLVDPIWFSANVEGDAPISIEADQHGSFYLSDAETKDVVWIANLGANDPELASLPSRHKQWEVDCLEAAFRERHFSLFAPIYGEESEAAVQRVFEDA